MHTPLPGAAIGFALPEDPTELLAYLLERGITADAQTADAARDSLQSQTRLLQAGRNHINAARCYIEDFIKLEHLLERYRHVPLPTEIAEFLREVQR